MGIEDPLTDRAVSFELLTSAIWYPGLARNETRNGDLLSNEGTVPRTTTVGPFWADTKCWVPFQKLGKTGIVKSGPVLS
jgi:hypothetical protein